MHDVHDYDRLRLIATYYDTMILKIIKNALKINVGVSNFIGG